MVVCFIVNKIRFIISANKKNGTSGPIVHDIPNQLVSGAILSLYFQTANYKQKKEARRPLFYPEEPVRSILTEIPLAVYILKVKCAE
jgi:hypothetical protein